MKRHTIDELKHLLGGTTPGEWIEERIGTVFRSTSVSGECGRKVLMVEVKDDDGKPHSDCQRKNAVLMVQARNLATALLEMTIKNGILCDEIRAEQQRTLSAHMQKEEVQRELQHANAQTARRCAEIAKSKPRVWPKDIPDTTPDPQTRIADKILAEFGLEPS